MKKRLLLLGLIAVFFAILASNAYAGCCVAEAGCTGPATGPADCEVGETYSSNDCSEIVTCDLGVCCGVTPARNYLSRSECAGIDGSFYTLYSHTPKNLLLIEQEDPVAFCTDKPTPCTLNSCGGPVPAECLCGDTVASAGDYCCSENVRTNALRIYENQVECTTSPSLCEAPEIPTVCTQDETQICTDGSIIVTYQCINGALTATGNICPTPACTAPVFEECPDRSTIRTYNCENGLLVATQEECPLLPPTIALEGTCGDGTVNSPNAAGQFEQCEADSGCSDYKGLEGVCTACECVYSCVDPTVSPSLAVKHERDFKLTLNWQLNTQCAVDKFSIYKCSTKIGASCTGFEIINEVTEETGKLSHSYEDYDVKANMQYCYKVDAVYGDGTTTSSETVCVNSGDEGCMEFDNEFCEENKRYYCDETTTNKKTLVADCEERTCIGPNENGATICAGTGECDKCNDLFGLFGQEGTAQSFFIGTKDMLSCISQIPSCYLDTTKTNIDKFYFCKETESCYDYKSEGACNNNDNTCQVGECEWISVNEEFGTGVCRPVDENVQQCGKCNEDAESGSSFFGACTPEMCMAYGDCYTGFNGACMDKKKTGCWEYYTEEQCAPDGNVLVDAVYEGETRVGNTNNILERSNDAAGFGLCKWNGISCFKDADSNDMPDCRNDGEDEACKADNMIPTTTLIIDNIPSVNGKLLLPKTINIPVSVSERAKTYFCISGTECYPDKRSACGIQENAEIQSGEYTLYYYSEDYSHNLEAVQAKEVVIDSDDPEINIILSSQELTNRNHNVEVILQANEVVRCNGHMETQLGQQVGSNTDVEGLSGLELENEINGIGTGFGITYYNIKDDKYYFVYSCNDEAGNKAEGEKEITLDSNKIHNPLPFGPVGTNTVTLSVQTDSAADCRYGTTTSFDSMTPFTETGSTQHSAVVGVEANRLYNYNVKCKFGTNTVGNEGDRIIFSSDKTSPSVKIVTVTGADFNTELSYGDDQTFYIECIDRPFEIGRFNFGCKETTYTIGTPNTFNGGVSNAITITDTQAIRIVAADNGGNANVPPVFIPIKIEKTKPELTIELLNFPAGKTSLEILGAGDYIVKVKSNKPLGSLEAFAHVNEIPVEVKQFKSTSVLNTEFEGIIHIPFAFESELFEDIIANGSIRVDGLIGTYGSLCADTSTTFDLDISKRLNFIVDTRGAELELKPSIENYASMEYPAYKYSDSDVYYTSDPMFFVSGTVASFVGGVQFYAANGHDFVEELGIPKASYSLGENAKEMPVDYILASAAGEIGSKSIFVPAQSLPNDFAAGKYYLRFSGHERESYGHYHEFYGVEKVDIKAYNANITLASELEDNIDFGEPIDLFTKPYPYNWFGARVNISEGYPEVRETLFYAGAGGERTKQYKLFLELYPPYVIRQDPKDFIINDKRKPLSILVRDDPSGALLDENTIRLMLTQDGKRKSIKPAVTKFQSGGFWFYNISYAPKEDYTGLNIANFTGRDRAGNPLTATDGGKPAFAFSINDNIPNTPLITFEGGAEHDGIWYSTTTPPFTIKFYEDEEVGLRGIFLDNEDHQVPAQCNKLERNTWKCTLDNPLQPRVFESDGITVIEDDMFDIIVRAHKIFAPGLTGDDGRYHNLLVIDNIKPEIVNMNYNPITRQENKDYTLTSTVHNEQHDLKGELFYKGIEYPLRQAANIGSFYQFVWQVPFFGIGADVERPLPFVVRLCDYAGNCDDFTEGMVTIDLTPPDITKVEVRVLESPRPEPEFITPVTRISVSGSFTDPDVSSVYLTPGDYDPYTNTYTPIAPGTVTGKDFTIFVTLKGPPQNVTLNPINITFIDEAGYQARKSYRVYADLEKPFAERIQIR